MLLLIGITLTRFALLSPDTARMHQELPEVAVFVSPKARLLQAPGETRGLSTALGKELLPTTRLAVWHGPIDSSHTYLIKAVRVRLGSRTPERMANVLEKRRNFREGRVELWLSPGTRQQGPEDSKNLLKQKLLLTPNNVGEKKGWLRFDVAEQRVVLPNQGAFLVAQGLTSQPNETFARRRYLVKPLEDNKPPEYLDFKQAKPSKGGVLRVYSYAEVLGSDGSSRLIAESMFPTLSYRMVEESRQCQSWIWSPPTSKSSQAPRWISITQEQDKTRLRDPDANDYNFDLELEVEEL